MLSEVLSMSLNLNVVLLDINTRGRLQQYLFNVLFVYKNSVFLYKGAAAFWFNIKKNGDLDPRTRHAGCPVLLGEKWGE